MAYTLRQVYEGVLVELNKVQAPSMLLEDFNYFANKAINQYVNKKYNVYDVNQQSTDDLRVLKSTTVLTVQPTEKYGKNVCGNVISANSLYGATYEALLPDDYLHLLNCICNYHVKKRYKCYDPDTYVQFGATRLTADLWGQIINNFYMKPSYKKPYYYLHNVNNNLKEPQFVPTNPYDEVKNPEGTDMNTNNYYVSPQPQLGWQKADSFDENETYYQLDEQTAVMNLADPQPEEGNFSSKTYYIQTARPYTNSNLPRTYLLGNDQQHEVSLVEQPAAHRLPNTSKVRIEIRTGKDNSIFELESIYIDYIKAPQYLRLTQEQIDLTEDTSQMMEFPDYVCQEIINELTHLIMENSSDTTRLQTHPVMTTSIGSPAQTQQQTNS